MKRREFLQKIWNDSFGVLPPGKHVAVAGGGLAGLHLAEALLQRGLRVTLYEPRCIGGVRIPLMHACQTPKLRGAFWENAAAFSRQRYEQLIASGYLVRATDSAFGRYYAVNARSLARRLTERLCRAGLVIRRQPFFESEAQNYDGHFLATGASFLPGEKSPLLRTTQIVPGHASYATGVNVKEGIVLPPRAEFVHLRDATPAAAKAEALQVFAGKRSFLFHGQRLVTRDRLPAIGFYPPAGENSYDELRLTFLKRNYAVDSLAQKSPFLFQGMGYHVLTYAPFLAAAVAAWLTGADKMDENLICNLSPTRFLYRNARR